MPMDVVLPLLLSRDFSFTPPTARGSCLRLQSASSDGGSGEAEEAPGESPGGACEPKKRVSFADQAGRALTRVRVFCPLSDPILVPAPPPPPPPSPPPLRLDFSPPGGDYLALRRRLDEQQVSLEHCELRGGALSGTVRVRNLTFQKSVSVRATFDRWRTHRDLPCAYVADAFPSAHSDAFAFELPLPPGLERLEFAVCFCADGAQHWDSNRGQNYCVVRAGHPGARGQSPPGPPPLDVWGSPICSHGLPPDWPSYAGYENLGPYY